MVDKDGKIGILAVIGIAFVVGGAIDVIQNAIAGKYDNGNWGKAIGDFLIGGTKAATVTMDCILVGPYIAPGLIPGAITGFGLYGTVGGLTNLLYGDDFWSGFFGTGIFGAVGGGIQGWALAKEMGLNPFWGWFGSVPGPTIPAIPALQQIDPEAIPKTQTKLNAPGKVEMKNPSGGASIAGEALEGPTTLRLIPKGEVSYKVTNFPKLDSKFGQHMIEWKSSISKIDYYQRSINLANSPVGGNILGHIDNQGWIYRFNTLTNEFLTIHPKGYIETFFIPKKGYEYWLRQLLR